MSRRIVHHGILWSVAILGTLWIATGLAIDIWSELRHGTRPIRFRVDRRRVA